MPARTEASRADLGGMLRPCSLCFQRWIIAISLVFTSLCSGRALLTATPASSAPRVDGKLDDPCWALAAGTAFFVDAMGDGLPLEQTRVQVCWDETMLYIGVTAYEGMLRPALNQLDQVKAEQSGRDANVFAEDCVEIFLQPTPDAPYMHLAANSGTGTYEGLGHDAEWTCDWTCKAVRGETNYTLEMAIPFSGMQAQAQGTWRANFTRSRPQAKELSTWSGLKGGFHQPEAFGDLLFAPDAPALTNATLDLGPEEIRAEAVLVGMVDGDVLELKAGAAKRMVTRQATGSGVHILQAPLPRETPAEGGAGVVLSLRRGGLLVAASATVRAGGTPQLFPKTSVFHLPRDSRQLLRVYLPGGSELPANAYRMIVELPAALECEAFEAGTAGGEATLLQVGTTTIDGVPMIRHAVAYDGLPGQGMELSMRWADKGGQTLAYVPALRTGGTHAWKHLSATVTPPPHAMSAHPLVIKWQDRGTVGTFWVDNIVFREKDQPRNLLRMGTLDEPEWKRAFPHEGADGSKCIKIVSTPANADTQQACWVDETDVVPVDPEREYIIACDVRCEGVDSPSTRPYFGLLVKAPAELAEGPLPMTTYAEALGGALVGTPRRSTINVLPPLRNVRPAEARICPCYYGSCFENPVVEEAYAENCWKSGITWTYGKASNGVVPHLMPRGHQVFMSLSWEPWSPPAGTKMLLEEHQDWRAVDFKGKALDHTVCPTLMLGDLGAPFLEALETWLLGAVNSQPYAGVNWDVEQPVIDPPTFCTCPRCLKAFRDRMGLGAEVVLAPDVLLETYREAWTQFRCSQNAEMAGHLKRILGKAERPIEFSMYSGYQGRRTREHYGVDWALLAPHLDWAIAGYNGARKQLTDTLKALDGVPFMGGEMWYLSETSDATPPPRMETWRNRILRQFVDSGCRGCLIWYLPPMDGGAFYATSEAAEIIATHEATLRHERRCDAWVQTTGLPPEDWSAFAGEDSTLVLLLSFSAESRTVTVRVGDQTVDRVLKPYAADVLVLPGIPPGFVMGTPAVPLPAN